MNIVFENILELRNLTACTHIAYERDNTITRRFGYSRIPSLFNGAGQPYNLFTLECKPDTYIFPVNCYGLPAWWSGQLSPEVADSPFDYVPLPVMEDLAKGRAVILFESLFEGYYDEGIYRWLHDQLNLYGIPPKSIAYISGAVTEAKNYDRWCIDNDIDKTCLVLGDPFLLSIGKEWVWDQAVSRTIHRRHKQSKTTWLYNCLNLRPRHHRQLMLCHLIESNLLIDGLVSHSEIYEPEWLGLHGINQSIIELATDFCPLVLDDPDFSNNKANSSNPMIYVSSWISIINETLADDTPQIFLSEKIVKPLISRHPFMIWGSMNSLKMMQELGFKTFHGFIDESYDTMPFDDRCKAIVNNLSLLKKQDLWAWWQSCESICEHNYQRIMSLGYSPTGSINDIKSRYGQLEANHD